MNDPSDLRRLRWRCRRGTRELDVLMLWWLDTCHPAADVATQAAFASLLDAQDPDLWDWVMARSRAPREDWQRIIDEIRRRHQL